MVVKKNTGAELLSCYCDSGVSELLRSSFDEIGKKKTVLQYEEATQDTRDLLSEKRESGNVIDRENTIAVHLLKFSTPPSCKRLFVSVGLALIQLSDQNRRTSSVIEDCFIRGKGFHCIQQNVNSVCLGNVAKDWRVMTESG